MLSASVQARARFSWCPEASTPRQYTAKGIAEKAKLGTARRNHSRNDISGRTSTGSSSRLGKRQMADRCINTLSVDYGHLHRRATLRPRHTRRDHRGNSIRHRRCPRRHANRANGCRTRHGDNHTSRSTQATELRRGGRRAVAVGLLPVHWCRTNGTHTSRLRRRSHARVRAVV